MRRATDARGAVATEAATPQGPAATSLRPAAGALNAAIANATRAARACLAADDPVVRATLTFAADGRSSVRVGSPFVEAPLAVPVTVRP